jgi:hypothetical protein
VGRSRTAPDQPSLAGLLWIPLCFAFLIVGEGFAVAGAAGAGTVWGARLIIFALGLGSFLIVGTFVIGYVVDSLNDPRMQEHINQAPARVGCASGLATLAAYIVAFVPVVASVVIAALAF